MPMQSTCQFFMRFKRKVVSILKIATREMTSFSYLHRASGHVDIIATVEALAVMRYELMLVVAVRGRITPRPWKLDLGEPRGVHFQSRVHVLTQGAVLGRGRGALECIAFENRLNRQITHPRVFLKVALRLEFVSQRSSEIADVFARSGLRKITDITLLDYSRLASEKKEKKTPTGQMFAGAYEMNFEGIVKLFKRKCAVQLNSLLR